MINPSCIVYYALGTPSTLKNPIRVRVRVRVRVRPWDPQYTEEPIPI